MLAKKHNTNPHQEDIPDGMEKLQVTIVLNLLTFLGGELGLLWNMDFYVLCITASEKKLLCVTSALVSCWPPSCMNTMEIIN